MALCFRRSAIRLPARFHREKTMIKKTPSGYKVLSEKGKNLGGPYKTKKAAEKEIGASGVLQTRKITFSLESNSRKANARDPLAGLPAFHARLAQNLNEQLTPTQSERVATSRLLPGEYGNSTVRVGTQ